MKTHHSVCDYSHDWASLAFAHFNKYPNPFASHVLQSDILERGVDPNTGILRTVRLHRKVGLLPSFVRHILSRARGSASTQNSTSHSASTNLVSPSGRTSSYILEESTVDPQSKKMVVRTRNLDYRRLISVEEVQVIVPHPEDSSRGQITTSVSISSGIGWGVRNAVEAISISKFRESMKKSRDGLRYVLARLDPRLQLPVIACRHNNVL